MAQPAAAAEAGGRPNRLVMLGVVLVMVSIAVSAGVAVNRLRAPSEPPAAGAAVGSPAPTTGTTAASASPGPSGGPSPAASARARSPSPATSAPSPRTTPSPSTAPATTDPGPLPDHPAAAFQERMRRGLPSYHLEVDGTLDLGNDHMAVEASFDVSGADYAGTMRVNQDRVRVTVEMVVKDGVEYVRPPTGQWERIPGPPEPMPGDLFGNFAAADWNDLEYVGPATRGGRELHHLRAPLLDWQQLSEIFLDAGPSGVTIRTLKLDVWVTDDGRPREAGIDFDATVRENGVEIDMTYVFNYRISGFGESVDIQPPDDFIDGENPTG